jgi:hypothetical protein
VRAFFCDRPLLLCLERGGPPPNLPERARRRVLVLESLLLALWLRSEQQCEVSRRDQLRKRPTDQLHVTASGDVRVRVPSAHQLVLTPTDADWVRLARRSSSGQSVVDARDLGQVGQQQPLVPLVRPSRQNVGLTKGIVRWFRRQAMRQPGWPAVPSPRAAEGPPSSALTGLADSMQQPARSADEGYHHALGQALCRLCDHRGPFDCREVTAEPSRRADER